MLSHTASWPQHSVQPQDPDAGGSGQPGQVHPVGPHGADDVVATVEVQHDPVPGGARRGDPLGGHTTGPHPLRGHVGVELEAGHPQLV